eukprot:9502321-Alexandrium_andersonii.AAC.1
MDTPEAATGQTFAADAASGLDRLYRPYPRLCQAPCPYSCPRPWPSTAPRKPLFKRVPPSEQT